MADGEGPTFGRSDPADGRKVTFAVVVDLDVKAVSPSRGSAAGQMGSLALAETTGPFGLVTFCGGRE